MRPHVRITLTPAELDSRFAAGATVAAVAAELGCTDRAVRAFANRHGIALPGVRRPVREAPVRAPKPARYPPLEDPGWLAGRLATTTARAVARELGCTPQTVRHAADRHGIARNRSHHPVEYPELHDRDALAEMRRSGLDVDEMAAAIGCAPSSVGEALREHGLHRRPRRPAPPARRLRADWRLFGSVSTVARLHATTHKTARRWLVEAGVLRERA